jgi:hypothetical protein
MRVFGDPGNGRTPGPYALDESVLHRLLATRFRRIYCAFPVRGNGSSRIWADYLRNLIYRNVRGSAQSDRVWYGCYACSASAGFAWHRGNASACACRYTHSRASGRGIPASHSFSYEWRQSHSGCDIAIVSRRKWASGIADERFVDILGNWRAGISRCVAATRPKTAKS